MNEIIFRKLRADEIQVRPTDTKYKGSATLLLYQDARCAMNILDETVGQFGWQKDYQNINGNIYCGIGIRDTDTGEWIWKWDCGSFNAMEEDMQSKADASDATKRAAVCWGIGRELYATPRIKIKCPDSYYINDKLKMSFTVKSIEWNGDKLESLVIVDRFGNVVYDYNNESNLTYTKQQPQINTRALCNKQPYDLLVDFCKAKKAEIGENEELVKFFKYYEKKTKTWTGKFNAEELYNKWIDK